MSGFDAIIKKIAQPPGAQNCARLNVIGDEFATTKRIAQFALAIPPFNYLPALVQCYTLVCLGLELETAKNAVLRAGSPSGRHENASFVEAFFKHDQTRFYSRCRVVESFKGEYRLSRDVRVPTIPTFTIIENGKLVPVTLCGWKTLPLGSSQLRYWMTMLEIGLYSHVDYRHSPAEVALFLENEKSPDCAREPHIIHRGDYDLLSASEMKEQAELYVRAQAAAMPLAEKLWTEREQRRNREMREALRDDGSDAPDATLFD